MGSSSTFRFVPAGVHACAHLRRQSAAAWAVCAAVLAAVLCCSVAAEAVQVESASVRGRVTTQGGTIALPGSEVELYDAASGEKVTWVTSDERGQFAFTRLRATAYRVRASLSGFVPLTRDLPPLSAGRTLELTLDLELEKLAETVVVFPTRADDAAQSATSREIIPARMISLAPLADDHFQSALPTLPGVVRTLDGRISLKGGRPSQTGLQVGAAQLTDPVTGDWGYNVPADAIQSVEVLASPFMAEYGRFSSGVAALETRQAANTWRFTANNLPPLVRWRDGTTRGIISWGPRVTFGGPLVKDRFFVLQSLELEKYSYPVWRDPQWDTVKRAFNSFTRADVRVRDGHTLTATVTVFPWRLENMSMTATTPPTATPDFKQNGYTATFRQQVNVGTTLFVESSAYANLNHVSVSRKGSGPMVITPDGSRDNFFNQQRRDTRSWQWTETVTRFVPSRAGGHLLKAGLDLYHASFDGASDSQPLIIRRADGTTSRRFDFGGPAALRASSTDLALFVQDEWRIGERGLVQGGIRVDRDGVIRRTTISPRLGAAIGVLPGSAGVIRGGFGFFYGRTPLSVAAFPSVETPSVTQYGPDGVTPVADTVAYTPRVEGPLDSARGRVWSLGYDQRLTPGLMLRINHLRRYGSGELLLESVREGSTAALQLTGRGRSRYQETEVTLRIAPRTGFDLSVTYVRSTSEADLNSYDAFYGNLRQPIVRSNEFGPTSVDVPHRLIVRGALPLTDKWSVAPVLEVRSGFPFSPVDENQEFVGPRNRMRFPAMWTLDLSVNRLIKFRKRNTWIGVRVYHLFNNFAPRDVQANVDSASFGTFYNSIPRRPGITFYIEP